MTGRLGSSPFALLLVFYGYGFHYVAPAAPAQAPDSCGSKIGKMGTPSEHVSLSQRAERYWVQSRLPLASLVFVAPLLIIYEAGVLLLGVQVQTGTDAFLRRLLELLGFGQHLLLPILTVCILLAWHYLSRKPWQLSGSIISAMAVESVILGLCLWVITSTLNGAFALSIGEVAKNCICYLGAGIYEELLFRLILLGLLAWGLRKAGVAPRWSTIVAVLLSSLLFAAAHYVGPYGDVFQWSTFISRTVDGVFLAVVFLYRGFGIAAGSHAAYDILLGVL